MTNTPRSSVVEIHVSTPVLRILRLFRMAALLAGGMLLASCWSSDTLLFPEEEFIDPWGSQHKVTRSAKSDSADQPLTLSPAGKWFQLTGGTRDDGPPAMLSFVPLHIAEATDDVGFLTVISVDAKASEEYQYNIGWLSQDGRELKLCGPGGRPNEKVNDRATLERSMREAILTARKDGEETLICGRLSGFAPVRNEPAEAQDLSLENKEKSLLALQARAKTERSPGRPNPAHSFVQLAGPSIECAGPYLGKVGFPQQGPNGELWYLMVVYFGDQTDETVHSPDFAACGDAVLKTRQYIALNKHTDKLSTPYRIIAFDRNFRVFLDSGVKN